MIYNSNRNTHTSACPNAHNYVMHKYKSTKYSNTPRPWSSYSLSKHKNSSEVGRRITCPKGLKTPVTGHKSRKGEKGDVNYEPQLEEFLQVMQPRSTSKLWANDTLTAPSLTQSRLALNRKHKLADKMGEKFDRQDEHPQGEGTLSSTKEEEDEPNIVVNDDFASDVDYYRSRVKQEWSDSECSDDEDKPDDSVLSGDDNGGSGNSHNKTSADTSNRESKNEEFLESDRLFIRNIPYTAVEEELRDHFSKFGNISHVHILVDKDTKRSKGSAYVSFALPESAARALEEMNGSIFQGRLLRVMLAEQRNISNKQEINSSANNHSKTFKQRRIADTKASEASGNSRAMNSFFMRQDTVVEYIARKFGVSKGEVLDSASDGLAVKIALAFTQVVAETKAALSSAGVNIASLEQQNSETHGVKKSNHVILAKNLPYGSSESELSTMFGKFGSLDKIILPPTKTLALVVFLEPAEARAAFNVLNYKRYKDGPLKLEWAPANVLSQIPVVDDNTVVGEIDVRRTFREQQGADITEADVDHDRNKSRSIYVKNLNFRTSDEIVRRHFTEHMNGRGEIRSVRVNKHQKNGKYVSKGYGFIEFDSVNTALNVCRDLQGTVLDAHALNLQLCHVKKDEQLHNKIENDRSSTKLIVRNVAFEATKVDLRQFLSTFGQIKSLRLPMALGKHKGFAFVEYVTKQEAQNALQALSNTHFFNRQLVLERAKEALSLKELRAKTAAQFTGSVELSRKRKHMTVLDEGNVKFHKLID